MADNLVLKADFKVPLGFSVLQILNAVQTGPDRPKLRSGPVLLSFDARPEYRESMSEAYHSLLLCTAHSERQANMQHIQQ